MQEHVLKGNPLFIGRIETVKKNGYVSWTRAFDVTYYVKLVAHLSQTVRRQEAQRAARGSLFSR